MKPIYYGGQEITDIFMDGNRIKKIWRGNALVYIWTEPFDFPPPIMNSNNQDGIEIISNMGNAYILFRNESRSYGLRAGQYVTVHFPEPRQITSLEMLSLNFETDSDNVGRFSFQASNDNSSWVTLIETTNGYQNTNSWRTYSFENPNYYTYYRYNFLAGQGGSATGLPSLKYHGNKE